MPTNKKKAKRRTNGGGDAEEPDLNAEVLAALTRLAETLAKLDEARDDVGACIDGDGESGADELVDATAGMALQDDEAAHPSASKREPQLPAASLSPPALPLSHWRTLPLPVASAYDILHDGASYLHATSTKYTLVGKVDDKEGGNLAVELRKGAELVGTATLLLFSPSCGSSRSLRHYVKQSSRALIASVISLVQSFEDGLAQGQANDGNNLGAQKTGAVWAACDKISKSVPRGNRAAMRRELMVWARDCNETVEEFEEVLALGPRDDGEEGEEEEMMDEDQYTEIEMGVAKASLNVMKCSRNLLGLVLKACECAGEHADEPMLDEKETQSAEADGSAAEAQSGEDSTQQKPNDQSAKRKELLNWIGNLHEMARTVGEGVTNLGILLYPPLDPAGNAEELQNWQAKKPQTIGRHAIPSLGATPLGLQLEHQLQALSECVVTVHTATLPGSGESVLNTYSNEVTDSVERLARALGVRCAEVEEAVSAWDERRLGASET
ncbi:hypothetical protein ACHAXT_011876 [Thalassiosira profunda]